MKETHIILRNPGLATRDVFLAAAATPAAAAAEATTAGHPGAFLPEMTVEASTYQSLEALPPILRGLGRKKRLSPEELEDLRSDIVVKLLNDDCRVLRRWDGRSSLKVYLATVVYNSWHDQIRRKAYPGAFLPEMTLEELFHQSLEALPPILRGLGRVKRFSPEDLEDLRSDIQIKLLEDDYRVLRRWNRRSSLKVYLGTVVYNIWHDRIRGEKGRVRVSAIAKRLGPPAPELEMLLGRQGLTLDEAYQVIKPRFPGLSRGEAEKIAVQINPRWGPDFVREGVVPEPLDLEPTGDKLLEQQEKLVKKRKALALMHLILSELPEQDRLLLVCAHAEEVKFSRIARSLGIDQRSLYPRNERLIKKLRTDLEEAGIRWEDLSEVLGIDEPPRLARSLGIAQRPLYRRNERAASEEAEEIAAQINPRSARRRVEGEEALRNLMAPSVTSAIPGHTGSWGIMAVTEICVTPTDLAVFLEGSLTGEERDRMVRHLNQCPDCFERYIGAARLLDAIEKEEASALSGWRA